MHNIVSSIGERVRKARHSARKEYGQAMTAYITQVAKEGKLGDTLSQLRAAEKRMWLTGQIPPKESPYWDGGHGITIISPWE